MGKIKESTPFDKTDFGTLSHAFRLKKVSVSNNKETLLSVAIQVLPFTGYPRTLNALKCINEIITKNKNKLYH
jgi:alkylhydroperoxidase/carboxymuconolactone decarboxylase family protein YurZ